MLSISAKIVIPGNEIELSDIRAQGAGGQNVNKVASAVHLRFDIIASSLPDKCKQRLLQSRDRRITKDGVIVIKAQDHRSREKNRQAALHRLQSMIRRATVAAKPRTATRPHGRAVGRRIEHKVRRGRLKRLRGKVTDANDV